MSTCPPTRRRDLVVGGCGWKGEWKIVNVLWELKPGAAK
jgi:hypothetical protein